jgi:hypothetical protein
MKQRLLYCESYTNPVLASKVHGDSFSTQAMETNTVYSDKMRD